MKAIGLYLRPLSDFHTGTQPHIESKAANVEDIEVEAAGISIEQQSEIPLRWKNDIEQQPVPHPDRHWWVVLPDEWFKHLDKPLRHYGDITDFVTTLNLCTNAPVVFSQSPGRIVHGYHEIDRRGNFEYKGDLSSGQLGIKSVFHKEIPNRVTFTDQIPQSYRRVRTVRESKATSDSQIDLLVALHMYDDALTGTRWTSIANLFYVCENILCSGYRTNPEARIAEETNIDRTEAEAWGKLVNRLKHPDKPDSSSDPPTTLLEMIDDETEIPSLSKMRGVVNTVLSEGLKD